MRRSSPRRAARYGTWRADPPEPVPDLYVIRQDLAENLIHDFMAASLAGGSLPTAPGVEVLGCYGIPLPDGDTVTTADAAGVEVSIGVQREQVFGRAAYCSAPVVAAAGLPADRSVRLAAVAGRDARVLIDPVACARQLPGRPGSAVMTSPRWRTCCCESPSWLMTCLRSPNLS